MDFSTQDAIRLHEEGMRLHAQGARREALAKVQAALDIFRALGDRAFEGSALNTLGMLYHAQEEYPKALEHLKQALTIRQEVWDRKGEGITQNNLGLAYYGLGRHEEALKYLQHALSIRREVWDRRGESKTLRNLVTVCRALGETEVSLAYLQEALALARELAERDTEGQLLSELGTTYQEMYRYEEAIAFYQQALTAARASQNQASEQSALSSLGFVYQNLGRSQDALSCFEEALALARVLGDRQSEGEILHNLAALYHALAQPEMMLEYAMVALAVAREMESRRFLGSALNAVGVAFREIHLYEDALGHYQQALEIARSVGNHRGTIITLGNIGVIQANLRQYETSLDSFKEALTLARDIGDQDGEGFILHNQAAVYIDLGHYRQALEYFEQAIKAVEALRQDLLSEELRIGYFTNIGDIYADYIALLVEQGYTERALEAVERSKSRTFLEQLGYEAFPTPEIPSTQQELLSAEAGMLHELRALQDMIRDAVGEAQLEYFAQQRDKRKTLDALWEQLEVFAPDYVALRRGDPGDYRQIQAFLDDQKVPAALVEFYTLPDRIVVFVLRSGARNGAVVQIPMAQNRLRRLVQNCEREVADYPRYGDIGQRWQTLAEPLLAEVLLHLDGVELVYLVPHGLVHYLPLHSLRVNGDYLTDCFPIAYAPSTAVLSRVIQRKTGMESTGDGREALVLGYTPSKYERAVFEGEAVQIADFFGTKARLSQEATGTLLREQGAHYDILHLSCHGFFRSNDPLASGLLLADGVLTARDIMGMRLNADLVTLSACQTALSDQQPGDELVGLTRALLYAGASSVLVTLWSVDAVAALELMTDFYSRLQGMGGNKGTSKVTALQEAMLELRKKREPPYYWAPFILVGDWR